MIYQSKQSLNKRYTIETCFSMQYLTPCGKTTVESADSAIYLMMTTLKRSQQRQHHGGVWRPRQMTDLTEWGLHLSLCA